MHARMHMHARTHARTHTQSINQVVIKKVVPNPSPCVFVSRHLSLSEDDQLGGEVHVARF